MMPREGRENSAAEETAATDDVEMGTAAKGEGNPTPTTPSTTTAAASEGGDDQERRLRSQTLAAETSTTISFPREIHHTTGGSQMDKAHTGQSEARERLKRIYEYTKKAISYELLMLTAVCTKQSDYAKIWAFKVSAAMLLLAFFADVLCAMLLLNSCHFPIEYPIYISSVSQMLMPLFLLFSFGELHPHMMIILTALLLFFAAALLHLACFAAGTTTDASKLDHIFDISAGFYALSAGSALTSVIVVSEKPAAAAISPLACSLFLTIFVSRYLMLITTLHTRWIINHAETLMYFLKLLVTSTVILVALELLGQQLFLVAISVGIGDVVLTSMSMLVHSPTTTSKEGETVDQRKEQQLLSAVMIAIPFMALTQTYSEHYTGQDSSTLLSAAKLRMLLYFVPLVSSLNRMMIWLGGVAVPRAGGHSTVVRVLATLEWVRTSIVVVAVIDMIYKFGIGLMYDKVVTR